MTVGEKVRMPLDEFHLTDVIPGFQIKLSSLFEKLSNPLAKN